MNNEALTTSSWLPLEGKLSVATPLKSFIVACGLNSLLWGCDSATALPEKPLFDVEAAVDKAFELFDANSDGALDSTELRQAPGLNYGLARVDGNRDRKVDKAELAQRLSFWNESTNRVFNIEVALSYRKRPVAGAEVVFEPEPFLADWLEPVTGTTDDLGRLTPRVSSEFPGVNKGYYRVRVSKVAGGRERLAAQFNEKTQIGIEFTDDRPESEQFLIELPLDMPRR